MGHWFLFAQNSLLRIVPHPNAFLSPFLSKRETERQRERETGREIETERYKERVGDGFLCVDWLSEWFVKLHWQYFSHQFPIVCQ